MLIIGQRGILNILMLFASRIGGGVVILFFVPLYNRLLGLEQFSVIVLILSLQSLLAILDLGVSTIVGREVSVISSSSNQAISIWRNAEMLMVVLYVSLIVIFLLINPFLTNPLSVNLVIGASVLCLCLAVQNLAQVVIIGLKLFNIASLVQLLGVLIRAVGTVLALRYVAATVNVFIGSQLIMAVVHLAITRSLAVRFIVCKQVKTEKIRWGLSSLIDLIKDARFLVVFGVAGAAVLQLDKPILAAFSSPKDVSEYFLAMTFCMTPLTILATPVAQYFQTRCLQIASDSNIADLKRIISVFAIVLVLVTGLPTMTLWYYRDWFVEFWLGNFPSINRVLSYTAILLPGIFFGSLGYIPFMLLTSEKDYSYQACFSSILTVITLLLVGILSYFHSISGVCLVYSFYHFISTTISWVRASKLKRSSFYARHALGIMIRLLIPILLVSVIVNLALSLFCSVESQVFAFTVVMTTFSCVLSRWVLTVSEVNFNNSIAIVNDKIYVQK